jgi:release factor glutamine methyltransferase
MQNCIDGKSLWEWYEWAQAAIESEMTSPEDRTLLLNELDWLITTVSSVDRLSLRLKTYRSQPQLTVKKSLTELSVLWRNRLTHRTPLQYLLGEVTWRDFTIQVAPGVLIPRPETELLIDLAQQAAPCSRDAQQQWADLGTGSGAIALGLARMFPKAVIHALDISPQAIQIAQQNAQNLGLEERIQFYEGRWLEPLAGLENLLQGVISNPPYIPSAMVPTLQPEVSHHEPYLALDGGEDGLDAIREIVTKAPNYLQPGGVLLIEIMSGQAETVYQIMDKQRTYRDLQLHRDLAGIERFILAFRR